MKGPTLTIRADTQAVDVQAYLNNPNVTGRLRAKPDAQGNMVLYTSAKRSGKIDRMTGRAAQKRDAAKQVVANVLERSERRAMNRAVNSDRRNAVTDNFRRAKNTLQTTKTSMTSVHATLSIAATVAAERTADLANADKSGLPIAKLTDLGPACEEAAGLLRLGADDVAQSLGNRIAQDALNNFTGSELEIMAFSSGIGLRQEVAAQLEVALGDRLDAVLPPGAQRDAFLQEVVESASEPFRGGDKQIDANTINVGGHNFKKQRSLAAGGFGEVFLYQRTKADGQTESIAVKFPLVTGGDRDQKLDEQGREVRMHKAASRNNSANIVGFKGAFRTSEGGFALAMEFAPHDNLHDLQQKLTAAVQNGSVSSSAATAVRLTLLQDTVKGFAELERNGLLHGDAKPPNVFIGAGGVAKVADFGTTQNATSYILNDSSPVENPRWVAPEVLKAQAKNRKIAKKPTGDQAIEQTLSTAKTQAEGLVRNARGLAPGQGFNNEEKNLTNLLMSPVIQTQRDGISAGNKIDSWALGVMGFNLLIGRDLVDTDFASEVGIAVEDFGENPNNRALGNGGFAPQPNNNNRERRLINALMHPDPNQRPSAQTAVNDAAFQQRGVGSADARNLIIALAQGNANDIAHYSGQL